MVFDLSLVLIARELVGISVISVSFSELATGLFDTDPGSGEISGFICFISLIFDLASRELKVTLDCTWKFF